MILSISLAKFSKKIKKTLYWSAALLILLLIAVHILLNSSSFLSNYILPEVNKRSKLQFSASELSINIFTGIKARDLEVVSPKNWTLTAEKFSLDYFLKNFFDGSLYLDDLELTDLKFNYPGVAELASDIDIEGLYISDNGKIQTEINTTIYSLELDSNPDLVLNKPVTLALQSKLNYKELDLLEVYAETRYLDIEDASIGAFKGNLNLKANYLIKANQAKGKLVTKLDLLNLSSLPNFHLEKGTDLVTNFRYQEDLLFLEKFLSKLKPTNQEQLNIAGQAKLDFKNNSYNSDLNFNSKNIELEKIIALFTSGKTKTKAKTKSKAEGKPLNLVLNYTINSDEFYYDTLRIAPAKADGNFIMPKSSKSDLTGKLSYDFQVSGKEMLAAGIPLLNPQLKGTGTDQSLRIDQLKLSNLESTLDSNGFISFADSAYQAKLDFKDLKMERFMPKFCGNECKKITGNIPSAVFDLKAKGKTVAELNKSLTGIVKIKGNDITLPAKLQDYFPVNIIAIPYDIISTISSLTIAKLLPKSLLSKSSEAEEGLSESGRIEIEELDLDIEIDQEAYHLEQADFDMWLIPSVDFSGSIFKNKDLDLEVGLWLTQIQVRIPIGGDTELPLPQLHELPIILAKGLGLSVVDLFPDFDDDDEDD